MKIPASLWLFLIITLGFMLLQLLGIYHLVGVTNDIIEDKGEAALFPIYILFFFGAMLIAAEIFAVILTYKRNKSGHILLKTLWVVYSVVFGLSAIVGLVSVFTGRGYNNGAEQLGGIIGVLVLPIGIILLSITLFTSKKINAYFNAL